MENRKIKINTYLNTLKQRGNLKYEYNPFHNYQTKENLYEQETLLGKVYVPEGKAVDRRNGQILVEKNNSWVNSEGIIIDNNNVIEYNNGKNNPDIVKDSLIDLDTDQLKFDLNNPVDIEIQPSYDGSVNLILNDDKNIPRLVNSRFSPREKNTYEIVDRIGENDTNIYTSNNFDKDTSLYFQYKTNPKIEYKGFINGILNVGQYCFYFTYCDADDNESDFIAETGLIPVFIGSDKDSYSIDGGIKNQLSNKGIKLKLTNLDSSYNYIKVYYVRYFADYQQNRVYEAKKIYHKYFINSNQLIVQITGNEEAEDIDPNILNLSKFNPQSILTQAQCKNMLFFGNIVKNSDNYKELQDCALRIVPTCEIISDINYSCDNNNYYTNETNSYYNSYNMYNKVGYFGDEYYRFGIVFIYQNGTLSNVYNVLGYDMNKQVTYSSNTSLFTEDNGIYIRNFIKVDNEGWIVNNGEYNSSTKLNSKGVCKIKTDYNNSYSVKFEIPKEVKEFLRDNLKIRGYFFVRQKRVPNMLGQCLILPMDTQLRTPVLIEGSTDKTMYSESFLVQRKDIKVNMFFAGTTFTITTHNAEERELDNSTYDERLYKYVSNRNISNYGFAGICPDFLLNQPYYNQIFNGGKFKLKKISNNSEIVKNGRYYNWKGTFVEEENLSFGATISTVTDDVPTIALKDEIFKLEVGKAEEAFRFEYAQINNGEYNAGEEDFDKIREATNLIRGKYSPYLAIYGTSLVPGEIYNIYQESFIEGQQQFLNRMNSSEPFYAISDRYNWDEKESSGGNIELKCYRGDCYKNVFTYRLNRNFNDSSLPNNDKIIDKKTWKDHYDPANPEEWEKISRSDINAVQLGSWITFKVMSPYNYALRSEDRSYVSEEALMGSPRSFYPRKQNMWLGDYKMPDSYLYNDAYRATLGYKCYFTLEDINYLKNTFSNRIQYSSIAIQDSFKNNYRESYSTYFRDYSSEYGSIQKLVGFEGYLLVVLEHAIGIATINERVLAGQGDGEPVFINTQNVLPEELTIITDTYGTQWPESVIKSEAGYVYGVDTVAKKIWRVKGQNIEILSDFKVNKFLIDNITLGEREVYPIIGLKNVKTHYNNNKKDIMFTFYDDVYEDEEKVWNLCYNELLEQFITFYSWIPSYSENIDTQFFTFNRDTSKALSLLNQSNFAISSNSGVLLNTPILKDGIGGLGLSTASMEIYYRDIVEAKLIIDNQDGIVTEQNSSDNPSIVEVDGFEIMPNHWGLHKCFSVQYNENTKIWTLEPKTTIENSNNSGDGYQTIIDYFDNHIVGYLTIRPYTQKGDSKNYLTTETVAFTLESIIKNLGLTQEEKNKPNLTTDFYLHGQAGIFDIKENLYPTYWYGKQHPFEFEFVVNDKIGQQKIFENLVIISNKAEPESFHFEIEGDNYEFSNDKRTMYFRQEATKNLYQNLGSDILYDRKFTDVIADPYTYEQYYRSNKSDYTDQYKDIDKVYPINNHGLVQQVKSTIFPLYYEKTDTYNDIYDKYTEMVGSGYDFKNLSGSEIKWNRDLNQFNIVTHIKNNPIDLVGRLRGNSRYKEGKWNVQIPSIVFNQKNEEPWNNIPPIIINSSNVPKDLTSNEISTDKIPNIYTRTDRTDGTEAPITDYIKLGNWTYRKEARIRDKWIKIRVRYSGKNLAVIHSLITLYNISYS